MDNVKCSKKNHWNKNFGEVFSYMNLVGMKIQVASIQDIPKNDGQKQEGDQPPFNLSEI